MTRVSVLMTMHNAVAFVGEAVSCILAQDMPDFELIVVDDGSTDGSADIVRGLDDGRIRLLSTPKIGRTPALILALGHASADYVAVLDADDTCLPRRFSLQCAFLDANPDVALVGSYCRLVDLEGRVVDELRPPTDHQGLLGVIARYNPFAHSSVMYRREAALAVGGYREDFAYAQDFDLWLRLFARYETAVLPEMLVDLRQHGGQMTTSPELLAPRLWDPIRLFCVARALPGVPAEAIRESRRVYAKWDDDFLDNLLCRGRRGEAWMFLAWHLWRNGFSRHALRMLARCLRGNAARARRSPA